MRRPARVQARVKAVGRPPREDVLGEHAGEQAVHAADGVAHGHRPERVPVIAAPDREQPRALRLAAGALELQAHLDRDLDRDRPRIGEEDSPELAGRQLEQPLGQAHGRLVGEAAEHHMRHAAKLLLQRRVEARVGVAVDRAPPRGHAVDQLAPVGELQAYAAGGGNRQRGQRRGQRAIGVPHALAVEREQCVPAAQARPTPRTG